MQKNTQPNRARVPKKEIHTVQSQVPFAKELHFQGTFAKQMNICMVFQTGYRTQFSFFKGAVSKDIGYFYWLADYFIGPANCCLPICRVSK
jgi:hypothetical protein